MISKLREFGRRYGVPLIIIVVVFAVVIVCCNMLSDRSIMGNRSTSVSLMVDCKRAVAHGIRKEPDFKDVIPEKGYVLKISGQEIRSSVTLDVIVCKLLDRNDIPYTLTDGQMTDIVGLKNGHFGRNSGWLCLINGDPLTTPMKEYYPKDGDYIELMFVTEYGEFL